MRGFPLDLTLQAGIEDQLQFLYGECGMRVEMTILQVSQAGKAVLCAEPGGGQGCCP